MERNSADCEKEQNSMEVENEDQEPEIPISERRVGDLRQFCEQLTEEKEKLLSEVTFAQEELAKSKVIQQKCEEDYGVALEIITQLESELYAWKNDYCQEVHLVETHEKSLKELQAKEESRHGETKKLIVQIQQNEKDQQRMKQQLQKQKTLIDSVTKIMNQLKVRNTKLQEEKQEKLLTLENIYLDLRQRDTELKLKEKELIHLKREDILNKKMMEETQKKVMLLEQNKMDLEQEQKRMENQILSLMKERDIMRKEWEDDKRETHKVLKDRDILHKKYMKMVEAEEAQMTLGKLGSLTKMTLNEELLNCKQEVQKQHTVITKLCKQNDNNLNEISKLKDKTNRQLEEIKVLEMKVFKYKETIADTENKLKMKHNQYIDVISELKNCSQKLLVAEGKIIELNQKIKTLESNQEQLRQELACTNTALLKEQNVVKTAERKKNSLKVELQMTKLCVQESNELIEKQKLEKIQLQKTIADIKTDVLSKKKELERGVKALDLVKIQLMQKNTELSLLSDKILNQQTLLDKTELQYNQRLEDIRFLKLEIMDLTRHKKVLTKTASNVKDLRLENSRMHQELFKEQAKRKEIEDQLPMNEHRWRRLKGNDPDTYELIEEIRTLHQRLIKTTEELVKKDQLLEEKEIECLELKQTVARLPGPKAAEQLLSYKKALQKRNQQIKGLNAEVNMYRSKMQEFDLQATENMEISDSLEQKSVTQGHNTEVSMYRTKMRECNLRVKEHTEVSLSSAEHKAQVEEEESLHDEPGNDDGLTDQQT